MKFPVEIIQAKKGFVEIEAETMQEALMKVNELFNEKGEELPDMEDFQPLSFECNLLNKEQLDYVVNQIVDRIVDVGMNDAYANDLTLVYDNFKDLISEDDYYKYFDYIVEQIDARDEVVSIEDVPYYEDFPYEEIMESAIELSDGNYFYIQFCDDGWDYTLYDSNLKDIDGGQLDEPEMNIDQATLEILEDFGYIPGEYSSEPVPLEVFEEMLDASEGSKIMDLDRLIINAENKLEANKISDLDKRENQRHSR